MLLIMNKLYDFYFMLLLFFFHYNLKDIQFKSPIEIVCVMSEVIRLYNNFRSKITIEN